MSRRSYSRKPPSKRRCARSPMRRCACSADHASVRLCGRDGRLDVGARSGVGCELPPLPFSKGQGLLGWVAQTGQPCVSATASASRASSIARDRGFAVGSVLSVPVRSGDRTLGVLSVSSAARDAFRQEDEVVAQLLASAAAQAPARGRAAQAGADRLADAGVQPTLPGAAAVRGDRAGAAPRGAAQRAADRPRSFQARERRARARGRRHRAARVRRRSCARACAPSTWSCAAAAKNSS